MHSCCIENEGSSDSNIKMIFFSLKLSYSNTILIKSMVEMHVS